MRNAACRLCLVLYFIILSACTRADGAKSLNPGEEAPDFEFFSLDGASHTLSEFRGKTVLINFWATWCPPCVVEMPLLSELNKREQQNDFVVLAIAVDDTKEAIERFAKRQKESLSFPLYIAKDDTPKKAYKLTGLPESFVIDREGKLTLVVDPDSKTPVVKLIGPKDWLGKSFRTTLEQISVVGPRAAPN